MQNSVIPFVDTAQRQSDRMIHLFGDNLNNNNNKSSMNEEAEQLRGGGGGALAHRDSVANVTRCSVTRASDPSSSNQMHAKQGCYATIGKKKCVRRGIGVPMRALNSIGQRVVKLQIGGK